MPNPNIPVPGTGIEAQWGANVIDRAVLVFADVAARDGFHTTPEEGQVCFVQSVSGLQVYRSGSWRTVTGPSTSVGELPPLAYLPLAGGTMQGDIGGDFDLTGLVRFTRSGTTTFSIQRPGYPGWGVQHSGNLNWVGPSGNIIFTTAGGLAIDGDPVNDTMVGDRGYNDGRYLLKSDVVNVIGSSTSRAASQALTTLAYNEAQAADTKINALLGGGTPISGNLIINGQVTIPGAGTTTNNGLPGWRQLSTSDRSLNALVSSARYKDGISDHDTKVDLDRIVRLRRRSWKSKLSTDDGRRRYDGFIAEEAVEAFPDLVWTDDDGQPEGFSYEGLISPLVGAVQELTKRVAELESKLEACCGS